MLATFDDAAWRADPGAVRDALEANRIVYFPTCPLPLPPEETLDFLRRVTGDLTQDARIGTCSFRPIEEKGRNLKSHASNELVHVDAGAYGATNGDRILRFFVNVNPDRDRVWATKGSFQDMIERYGERAGLLDDGGKLRLRIEKRGGDRVVSALVAGLARLNPLATVRDARSSS